MLPRNHYFKVFSGNAETLTSKKSSNAKKFFIATRPAGMPQPAPAGA
jgi:hypothetical protein